MEKSQDGSLVASSAVYGAGGRTPDASVLHGHNNGPNSMLFTSSQISSSGALFSTSLLDSQEELSAAQAINILKLRSDAAETGSTFALLDDKEIMEKLHNMHSQVQSLTSTVCVMSEDVFSKSEEITRLTAKLRQAERQIARLSFVSLSACNTSDPYDGAPMVDLQAEGESGNVDVDVERTVCTEERAGVKAGAAAAAVTVTVTVATDSNADRGIGVGADTSTINKYQDSVSASPPVHYRVSEGTPPVTMLTNEPALDSTPPLTQTFPSNPPDDTYEPETPTQHQQQGSQHYAWAEDPMIEITELKASINTQDKIINALVTIANEEAAFLKVLLNDEMALDDEVDAIPDAAESLDTLMEAGISLFREDVDVPYCVKIKLKELRELRLTNKLLNAIKQPGSTDERVVSLMSKAATALTRFERAFYYFVILGLVAFLFSQWMVNPWKYS